MVSLDSATPQRSDAWHSDGCCAHDLTAAHEMHHRVANGLQIVAGMIGLASHGLEDGDAKAVLSATRQRIDSIAKLNRLLTCAPSPTLTDLRDYLVELGQDLEKAYCSGSSVRRVRVDAAALLATPQTACDLGMIISELVCNACKYAYTSQHKGDVRVLLLKSEPNGFILRVEDDGIGRAHRSIGNGGLGVRLIGLLAQRLGGRLAWQDGCPGTRFVLEVSSA